MEKVLKDGKLYSLIEFRDRIYEDLDLSKSDLTTLLCAMLIASIGLNMNSIPTIIGAMLISPLMTPWSRLCVSNFRYKTSQKVF